MLAAAQSNSLDQLGHKSFGPCIPGGCADASLVQLIRNVCVGQSGLHKLIDQRGYLLDVSSSFLKLTLTAHRILSSCEFSGFWIARQPPALKGHRLLEATFAFVHIGSGTRSFMLSAPLAQTVVNRFGNLARTQ